MAHDFNPSSQADLLVLDQLGFYGQSGIYSDPISKGRKKRPIPDK